MKTKTNNGILFGGICGILCICLYVGLYNYNTAHLFQWMGISSFVLIFLFMLMSGFITKKQISTQQLSIRRLIQPIFTTAVVGLLLLTIFQYFWYNFVDTSMAEQLRNWNITKIEQAMQGASDYEKNRALAEWRDADLQLTLSRSLQQYFFFLVPSFILAVIVVAIVQILPISRPKTP